MTPEERRARVGLGLGAVLGVALAVGAIVRPNRGTVLPDEAVAMVGSTPIARAEYERAVAAVESDRSDHTADPDLRQHIMDRLIDEELLVQGALDLGLPSRDPRLRAQIAAAMLESIIGEPSKLPSDETLRAFHKSREATFTRKGRVQIEALFFRGDRAGERALTARERLLAGEPLAVVGLDADPIAVSLPNTPLPASKLAEYVGPALATAVQELPIGGITQPTVSARGTWVARLVERASGELAAYETVEREVKAEWHREDDDARLRRWLETRRHATKLAVREGLP